MSIQKFIFEDTSIQGVKRIQPFVAEDERGYLSKVFEKEIFANQGIKMQPYEELQSFSKKGTLRGLHFQKKYSQDKLVRVITGAVFDVAVDLRPDSLTFGKWESAYLSAENRKMFYIPKGFAHGFLALEENTTFSYLCGDRYDPQSDGGIIWNDPQIAVKWPLENVQKIIISSKDENLPSFSVYKIQEGIHK